ncbi:MAG TPA: hypothetical protein ENI52_06470 [Thermoplasmata archaeon]|nr:hypothetical protein [Thermoplasmata archaeon]
MIKKITISGFRGINFPLVLDFAKGNSLVIYGRNGTGKSSITDAWEWFHTGKIKHLAREGAGEQSYPHKYANEGETYMEVEFLNPKLHEIKLTFNPNRITQPDVSGNRKAFKELVPHPCHLRYRDLTEFVYMTKAQRYEFLSRLMGLEEAINIQNNMTTCANRIEQLFTNLKERKENLENEYKTLTGAPPELRIFLKTLNGVVEKYSLPPVKDLREVETIIGEIKKLVERDTKSIKLNRWKNAERYVSRFYPLDEKLKEKLAGFCDKLLDFQKDEEELIKIILIDFYEKGIQVIKSLHIYNRCPFCDKEYEGNLLEYISGKQEKLKQLKERRENLESMRGDIIHRIDIMMRKIEDFIDNLRESELSDLLTNLRGKAVDFKLSIERIRPSLQHPIEKTEKIDVNKIDWESYQYLLDYQQQVQNEIKTRITELEEDKSRKELIEDFQKVTQLYQLFIEWLKIDGKIKRLEKIRTAYEQIKNDFVDEIKSLIEYKFNTISNDVTEFFNILEKDATILSDPKIKLLSTVEKGIELEIGFAGTTERPVFKVLSESQLNSFGLAVFLASVKNFNSEFNFFILDDVINSFDTYKRPRVIELLKEHFSNYQILLLTHDEIWLDQLYKAFPNWGKVKFTGWDISIGPKSKPAKDAIEEVKKFIEEDEPRAAGWRLGLYLEWMLQELCERLQAEVKYNRRNEFTLYELYQALRMRLKEKIGGNHLIVRLLNELDTGFRNFSDHYKDTSTTFSSQEILDILNKWLEIENKFYCPECNRFVIYQKINGIETILCPCGKLKIK